MIVALMQSVIALMEVIALAVSVMALITIAIMIWIILETIRRRK
ncbi:hypothetical protein AAK706_07540 [Erysipelotrichaceae bacterium 66-17]